MKGKDLFRRLLAAGISVFVALSCMAMVACGNDDNTPPDNSQGETPNDGENPGGDNEEPGGDNSGQQLVTDATPTIFLAGDSTVKTYEDAQYIAGWGQIGRAHV